MTKKTGSTMLLVVLLMSIVLVLCAKMWQTTAYVIDIAVKKQEAVQHYWAAQGILKCGIAACRKDFDKVFHTIKEQGGSVTVPLHSYKLEVPHLKQYTPLIAFVCKDDTSIELTASLRDGQRVIKEASCVVHHRE